VVELIYNVVKAYLTGIHITYILKI